MVFGVPFASLAELLNISKETEPTDIVSKFPASEDPWEDGTNCGEGQK